MKQVFQFTVSRLCSKLSLGFLRHFDLLSAGFQNLPTILKLTSLGVKRFGMAYTLFAKSLMS